MIGHVVARGRGRRPDRARRGGRHVSVDVDAKELNLEVDDDVLAERRARWTPPAPNYTTGALAKYAALVSSASEGAITSGAQLRADAR